MTWTTANFLCGECYRGSRNFARFRTGYVFGGIFVTLLALYAARVRGRFKGPIAQANSTEELLKLESGFQNQKGRTDRSMRTHLQSDRKTPVEVWKSHANNPTSFFQARARPHARLLFAG